MIPLLAAIAANVLLSAPQPVADLDAAKMKGDLSRLAWSDDGSEFYVQTVEKDKAGNIKAAHHFVVSVQSKALKDVGAEPAWASKYWAWKSGQASPASAGLKIEVTERTETRRSVSAPTGGALARGGTDNPLDGTSFSDVAAAKDTSQTQKIFALTLRGETIGEWSNEAVTPGSNFSWAPAPLQMIAYAKRGGGPIIVLDNRSKYELAGVSGALLPAWSANGKRIAWIERKDKKTYQLMLADISVQ